jgi:hypothetical protein
VFVCKQKDGSTQDFIEGPFDDTIKTANFPVLSSIAGLAFGGGHINVPRLELEKISYNAHTMGERRDWLQRHPCRADRF